MWLPVSTLAALCVFIEITETAAADDELKLIFKDRTYSDWKEAWHKEKYVRCRETLLNHLYWACEKDIYKITRRSVQKGFRTFSNDDSEDQFPWIDPRKAKSFVRFRRGIGRRGGTITSECCKSAGCTWEEYAEYCPTNKRYTSYV